VSETGNGSLNPTFQIGRAYNALYSKTFYNIGSSYDWQYTKFKINGADGTHPTKELTFGLSSADAAVELDYLRCYEINKTTGLKDIVGTSTIDLSNVSFDANGQIVFDGTNDWLNIPVVLNAGNFTYETVMQASNASYQIFAAGTGTPTSGGTTIQAFVNSSGALINLYAPVGGSGWQYGSYNNQSGYVGVSGAIRHIVVVNSNTNWKTYVNSVLVGDVTSFVPSVGNAVGVARSAMQAASTVTTTTYMSKIYNRALSTEEVLQNFNATKSRFGL